MSINDAEYFVTTKHFKGLHQQRFLELAQIIVQQLLQNKIMIKGDDVGF